MCKPEQIIKAEVMYVSQWFCIVGLKAHALGRLAILPLFRNDFTQLNTFRVGFTFLFTTNEIILKYSRFKFIKQTIFNDSMLEQKNLK